MIKKQPDEGPLELLTASQVANMLQISRSLVYRLIWSGKLPTVRLGHALRFRLDDVQALASQRAAPPKRKGRRKGHP